MFKLIIFDMDGLMFDTEGVMCRAFLEVTAESGYPSTRDQFIGLLGLNSRDIQKKYRDYYGEDVDAAAIYRACGDRKMEILETEGVPVKKGLSRLLDEIDRLGIKKAVASSSDLQVIKDNVDRAGFGGRFDLLMSSASARIQRGKPYPDLFLAVCREFAVKPGEALVLEDSVNGVEAAIAGGIPVIQVPDFVQLPESLKKQCLSVVDSLDQVIPFLCP
ncbi:MAG: HAD family phosphatase [Eubacterium sp.]|nr:HAD family phosphatase [Eubacterium sp.]